MKKLSIAYFGTPYLSGRFLEKLLNDQLPVEVSFVVTQPDKPVGKKQIITPSPVKQVAQKYHLPIFNYDSSKFEESLISIDLGLIYFYGKIIPKKILTIPQFGFWNIHFSLLPQYRGAYPTLYSLIMGDETTGVSFVQTNEKLDEGDLIAQEKINIINSETKPALEERLHNLSYEIFQKKAQDLFNHRNQLTHQNNKTATYTRFPVRNDGFIPLPTLQKALKNEPLQLNELPKLILDYINKYNLIRNWKLEIKNSSKIIFDYFRGLYPWPGIWTQIQPTGLNWGHPRRLKITDMDLKGHTLVIKKVQLEGKNEVDFKTFQSAYTIFTT